MASPPTMVLPPAVAVRVIAADNIRALIVLVIVLFILVSCFDE
jgi:hypothetical protein